MTISRRNLSIIVVSFMSDEVIHNCINSIPDDINIIVVDNSSNKIFKQNIEKRYNNVHCILSHENLGMGSGNNLGLKKIKTDYAFIINPDVIFEENTIDEIINASNNLKSFAVIAPILNNKNFPNYKLYGNQTHSNETVAPFKVKSVDGFALVLNIRRLNKLESFKDKNYFDENFFLYLENDDLCKRIIDNNENIYIAPTSRINHLGGSAVDKKFEYEVELSRNWHWIWSKFYYNKKHNGFLIALLNGFPSFFSAIFKIPFYFFFDKRKKDIYYYRALGFLNALLGRKSYLRPKINN